MTLRPYRALRPTPTSHSPLRFTFNHTLIRHGEHAVPSVCDQCKLMQPLFRPAAAFLLLLMGQKATSARCEHLLIVYFDTILSLALVDEKTYRTKFINSVCSYTWKAVYSIICKLYCTPYELVEFFKMENAIISVTTIATRTSKRCKMRLGVCIKV